MNRKQLAYLVGQVVNGHPEYALLAGSIITGVNTASHIIHALSGNEWECFPAAIHQILCAYLGYDAFVQFKEVSGWKGQIKVLNKTKKKKLKRFKQDIWECITFIPDPVLPGFTPPTTQSVPPIDTSPRVG